MLNNELPSSNVNALTADGLVVNAVKQDPNAIGYDGLAWQGKGQKTLKVNGVPCEASKISVEPLKYPLSRYIFLVLPNGVDNPALQKFIDWARRSPVAGEVIVKAGGVPAFNKKAEEVGQMEEEYLPEYGPKWSDQRAERMLGALVCAVVGLLLALIVTVFVAGLAVLRPQRAGLVRRGGNVDEQLNQIYLSGLGGANYVYTFHAWQLIWSTILITGGAVLIALFCSLFVSVFIVEFAPEWMRNILQPVVRFLASVPSVIYGLLGVLVIVPFIGNHLVTESQKASVAGVISLSGYSLLAAVLILTVMIAPLMVSIFSDGLRSVRPGWLEGSLALGVNRWRTIWKIAVRTARPAIVAGTVLATARAIGEAVMLAMVSGSVAFAPNPADGLIFIFEPSRPLAPTIVKNIDSLGSPPANATLFAIAAVLLFSAAMFSLAGWVARRAMRKYGATA